MFLFFFKSGVKYMVKIFNLEGYRDDPLNIAAIYKLKETLKKLAIYENDYVLLASTV